MHAKSARVRLAVAMLGLMHVLASPRPSAALVMAAASMIAAAFEGVRRQRFVHVLAMPWLFGGVAVLLRLWLAPSAQPGLLLGARIAGATCIYAWLVCTLERERVHGALAALGMPREIVEMMALTQRYAHVFQDTLQTARTAQILRLGYSSMGASFRSCGVLAGLIISRAVDQSTMLATSLHLRGYSGHLPFPRDEAPTVSDLQLVVGLASVVLLSDAWPW